MHSTRKVDFLEIEPGCREQGVAARIILHGEVDFRDAPSIGKAVKRLLKDGNNRIDICLGDVVFMDSSGISALLVSQQSIKEVGAQLVLVSPTQSLLHVLEMSGFSRLFEYAYEPKVAKRIGIAEEPTLPFTWQMTEFYVPCVPHLVSDIRRRIAQIAASMPFDTDQIEDIKLAVGEASANAFRYGCPNGCDSQIHVRCVGTDKSLTVEITDCGPGFDPASIPPVNFDRMEMGGRGIHFMRSTMDEVEFIPQETGTMVRMVKNVGLSSPP
jgi:anti-anti-sigma factor